MKKERKVKMRALIRSASIEQVEVIFQILREAFQKYLIFTPYISNKSINLIKRDIVNQNINLLSDKIWRVLEIDGVVCAFYCINIFDDMLFLNYIGVDTKRRNRGWGSYQLNDIYKYALMRNIYKIELEVFKSNAVAMNWYKAQGFVAKSSRYIYLLKNNHREKEVISSLAIDSKELRKCLFEECTFGCSKLTASYLGEKIEISLINNEYIKILKPNIDTQLNLLGDLTFYFGRNYIIFSSNRDLDGAIDFERKEEIIQMQKIL